MAITHDLLGAKEDIDAYVAFAFISVAFSLIDFILNFFFYYRRYTVTPASPTPPTPHRGNAISPAPSILKKKSSVFNDEDFYNDIPRTQTGHSTEV
ncbi:hypothetical protein KIN20_026712 [Parelaphostrongylus tenuis]|uniref:Uncharacterized protein n=1 Tax=Parelaphostrongylus tenuis TaxID=148309 RepID=A0AAD5QYD5_PARTN|nr:hypothetical protein KIN20_026712 [Parelaphostrongylus tenuis]